MSVPGGPPNMQQPYGGHGYPPQGYPPGMQQPMPARPSDPVKTAAIVLAVCAGLILIAMISKSWVTAKAGSAEIHIGPIGVETCHGSMCVPMGGKIPTDIELVMLLAVVTGFASAAGAGWYAGAFLANKRDKLPPAKLVQIAFGLAAFSFTFFVIRMFSEGGHGLGPGWATFVGIGGVIVANIFFRKLVPHMGAAAHAPLPWQQGAAPGQQAQGYGQAPQAYGQPSQQAQGHAQAPQGYGQAPAQPPPQAQPQAAPACPRCGQPLQFVAQYQRWFCTREQQYV